MTIDNSCTAVQAVWPVQRILFLIAGTVTLIGVLLAAVLTPWFLLAPAIVGANQLLMVAIGWCPASLILTRFGVPDLRDRAAN